MYGKNSSDHSYYNPNYSKETNHNARKFCSPNTIITLVTGLASFLSVLVLIAVNINILINNSKNDETIDNLRMQLGTISSTVINHDQLVNDNIKPQVTLINTQVSFNIPSQINSVKNQLSKELIKVCAPKYENNQSSCPVVQNPVHSKYFTLATPKILKKCFSDKSNYIPPNNLTFLDFPSFIPGPTKPGGCTRIPSFSLSQTIFSYTHNVIERGCRDHSSSSEYFSIGRIVEGSDDRPAFQTIQSWHLDDKLNRKSCVTASDVTGAWLACNIVTMSERDDYLSPGIMKVYLSYRDVYGRIREWIYNEQELNLDYEYNALYFGVGSGTIKNGKVYFLMYGGLSEKIEGNAYCHAPECTSGNATYNQEICNQAQSPHYFGDHQIVISLLEFNNEISQKPRVTVKTFKPNNVWMGAEGRLLSFDDDDHIYIYLRSTSWHSLLQVGKFLPQGDMTITWVEHHHMSRPGVGACTASNRCPASCITGVYADFYPFSDDYTIGISGYLRTSSSRANPWIRMASTNELIGQTRIAPDNQKAAYSTTTCFIYHNDLWCLTIFEFSPATVGVFQPVPFLYRIITSCWTTRNLDEYKPGLKPNEGSGFLEDLREFIIDHYSSMH